MSTKNFKSHIRETPKRVLLQDETPHNGAFHLHRKKDLQTKENKFCLKNNLTPLDM